MKRDLKELVAEAKELLTIPDVWRRLGLPGEPRNGVQKSPLRDDRHGKAFSIYARGKMWKDHGDGSGGDAVIFVETAAGCSRAQAMRTLVELAGLGRYLDEPAGQSRPRAAIEERPAQTERGGWGPRQRPVLPEIVPATSERIARLAELRGLSIAGVEAAVQCGLLVFCGKWLGKLEEHYRYLRDWDGEAWMVLDGTRCNAQLRRLDGRPLWGELKGITIPDSWANWPLGCLHDGPRAWIMVEGAPDLLAACDCIAGLGLTGQVRPIGILGAGQHIHPGSLAALGNAPGYIIAQRDEAKVRADGTRYWPGQEAALRWQQQIGGRCTVVELPAEMPGKDLNDWVKWSGRGNFRDLLRQSCVKSG